MELKRFEKRVYLSSPTMHPESFEYMKEAYDTNWMSTVGANINDIRLQRRPAARPGGGVYHGRRAFLRAGKS